MSDFVKAQDIKSIGKTIVNADGTNYVDLYDNSAGAKAVRVEGLSITSDDTSTVNIQFAGSVSGVAYSHGTVRVVTLSGTDGAAARVIALGPDKIGAYASDGIYDLWVAAGEKLQARSLVAVTSGKTVTIKGRLRTYA